MSLVKIDWNPTPKSLRSFGLVVFIGLGIVAAVLYFFFNRTTEGMAVAAAAAILGLPALTGTKVALPGYWFWMGIAFVMGNIMSRIVLALIYYLVLTPTGLLMRVFGIDKLRLKKTPTQSYWNSLATHSSDTERYERQF